MEIHKPKPVHNWRELLTELGIVVLGVSIALAAEQTVEYFHWRAQVVEAREFIATEMAGDLRLAIYRMRTATCTERRLDELGAVLDGAARTGKLPPLGDISMPPRGYWPSGAWESVVASQTATHFPRQQLADITLTYKIVTKLEEYTADEFAAWNSLYAMTGPGRRLDPASEARLRDALSHARSVGRLVAIMSDQLAARVNTLGLPFSPTDLALIDQGKQAPLLAPRTLLTGGGTAFGAICAPMGQAPSLYGQGYYNAAAPQIDDAVKNLPDFAKGAR